jgi:hypothetical protein
MECRETGECLLCEDMMDALQRIRHELGSPMTISSGYRSPRHSIEAAKDTPGAHATGKAVDVACDGAYAYQVLSAAMRAGFTGIGIQQNGVSRFIHLDYIRMAQKAFWDKKNPRKKSKTLTTRQKAAAKARAKRAGRPYPNLVDNAAVARKKKKK